MKKTDFTLDLIAKLLIRCFWIGMALIMASFFLYLAVGDWGYELHKNIWSGLTRHDYSLVWVCILSFFKDTHLCGIPRAVYRHPHGCSPAVLRRRKWQ